MRKRHDARPWLTAVVLAMVMLFAVRGNAQPPAASLTDKTPPASLAASIAASLASEERLVEALQAEKRQADQSAPAVGDRLDAYRTQHAVYANMLALHTVSATDLEAAGRHIQSSLVKIHEQQARVKKAVETVEQYRSGIEDQVAVNQAYLAELTAGSSKGKDAGTVAAIQRLIDLVNRKQALLDGLHQIYTNRLADLKTMEGMLTVLSGKLEGRVQEARKRDFFSRSTGFPIQGGWEGLRQEMSQVAGVARSRLSVTYLVEEGPLIWRSLRRVLAYGVLLVLLAAMGMARLAEFQRRIDQEKAFASCTAFQAVLYIFPRSMWLLLITALLFLYMQAGDYLPSPLIVFIFSLARIFLVTRWVMDAVDCAQKGEKPLALPARARLVRRACQGVRLFGVVYATFLFLAPNAGGLLFLSRLLFEVGALVFALVFWRGRKQIPDREAASAASVKHRLSFGWAVNVVCVGGLALELAGHGPIALYWYISWGRTLVIALWVGLVYAALGELRRTYQVDPATSNETAEAQGSPVWWILIRLGQAALVAASVVALIVAWGGGQDALMAMFDLLHHPYEVGTLSFRIIGFIYAVAALFITHMIAGAWRYLFERRVLRGSGMTQGAQESVVTITIYIVWAVGILAALHVAGINTTSLAVVLGAIGIGLGFGLQNIFNNFVSGLILLFERPIQVGDDIEVDGTWATVKKINVRATIVQTYDNASLIIPNAELISNRVINWSFQDKRLRRKVAVGVAYGSDVELVRTTLLEVAAGVPHVLKTPKPDVVFKDFGDSSLVFLLRFWTHVAYFYAVETEVRFAIDRLFRERGITIAFPQMDVHLHSETPPPSTDDE